MDVSAIKAAILDAIASDSIGVIGLVGKWGVGKTFLVKSLIQESRAQIAVHYEKYCYVSLFGFRSLQEVRAAIVAETAPLNPSATSTPAGEKSPLEKATDQLRSNWATWSVNFGGRFSRLFGNRGKEALDTIVDVLDFARTRNVLICLDDLERTADQLGVLEVMGLVDRLARERSCKVLLIFSRDNLSGANKVVLNQYREKVFDREILLDPPLTYSVSIASAGLDPAGSENLTRVAEALKLKNVRVLRKIALGYRDVLSKLPALVAPLNQQVMFSLGILYYCNLISGPDVPSLDEVMAIEFVSPIEHDHEETHPHVKFLRELGWTGVADFDKPLARYVQDGVCDWDQLREVLLASNSETSAAIRREEVNVLWQEYRRSFKDDAGWAEFGERLYAKCREHVEVIGTHDVDSALWLLRTAGLNGRADELLHLWAEANSEKHQLFDLERLEEFGALRDQALRALCQAKEAPAPEVKTIMGVLRRISEDKSWGGDDIAHLFAARIDEYVAAFTSAELTASALDGARFFLRLGNPSPEDLEIRRKIIEALKVVAAQSAINRERVRGLGIDLDPAPQM